MALQTKYNSYKLTKNSSGLQKSITYYGAVKDVEDFLANTAIGTTELTPGFILDEIGQGYMISDIVMEVECSFTQPLSNGSPAVTIVGPSEAVLNCRQTSIGLENLKAKAFKDAGYLYLSNWNYALAAAPNNTDAVPSWWATATNLIISNTDDRKKWAWIKDENDVMQLPQLNGKYWSLAKEKTKPGVEAINYCFYEIVESGKHKTKADAAWIATKTPNTVQTPSMGTFGITGGEWLCLPNSVFFDGKNWIAQVTYLHTPTKWDRDLYKVLVK